MPIGIVLVPTFEGSAPAPAPGGADASLDLGSLAGRRVGVRGDELWRSWDVVSDVWAEELERQGASVVRWDAGTRTGSEGQRAEKERAEFLDGLDLAVVGLGTCGSCTMWTINDALAAAEQGIPTIAVVTEHFAELARGFAQRGGRPDLPLFVLPYPLETRPEAEVRAVGKASLPDLLVRLGVT